ncbi:MAG: NAD-dependent DNA ligase LigA, partial [Bacilli bacterium]|nr:NAD-dependent DNA ligase LigA [Bacilli bacterium]
MDDIKKRIFNLETQLKNNAYEYYTLDNPSISDVEYDYLYHELLMYYENYPSLITNDSITRKVGYQLVNKFTKYQHAYQMYSLDNAFNFNDLDAFDQTIRKESFNYEYVVEPKIDGLAISLTYKDGLLESGVTRGNGLIGENVTNNIKTISDIPIVLNEKIDLVVRGEVYLKRSMFNKINEDLSNNNKDQFVNARNAAAGTLRQLDSKIVAKRQLSAFFYNIANYQELNLKTHFECLTYLKKLGFCVNDQIKLHSKMSEVEKQINVIESKRALNDYDIDGAVIKINDLALQEKL